jgi:hypothetical protein
MGWVENTTPWPLYPRERHGTYCIGDWVGPRADLDGCGKSRPHRDSIPGPSSPHMKICHPSARHETYAGVVAWHHSLGYSHYQGVGLCANCPFQGWNLLQLCMDFPAFGSPLNTAYLLVSIHLVHYNVHNRTPLITVLSHMNPVQPLQPLWTVIIALSSHLTLVFPVVSIIQISTPKLWRYFLFHACHMPCPSHPPSLDHTNKYQDYIMKLLTTKFSPAPSYFILGPQISSTDYCLWTTSACYFSNSTG